MAVRELLPSTAETRKLPHFLEPSRIGLHPPTQHSFNRPRLKSLDVYCFQPEEKLVQLKKNKNSEATVKVYPFWVKKSKSYAQRILSRRIVELTKRRQLGEVLEVLENAMSENVKPNRVVMNSAMAACVHCGNVNRAFLIYDSMLEPGSCGVDNITYTILLKGLGESRMLDEAYELMESIEKGKAAGRPALTEVHVRTLLNAFADAGEILRARGVLIRYRSLVNRMGPSIFTYNILIKGYAKSDSPLEALKLRDDMTRLGLQPQRITFNSLILACVKGGDLGKALQLLREMKEEAQRLDSSDLLPNVVTYTTLIQGFGEQGLFDGVISLVNELRTSPDCALDRVAYGVIIDAYISAGSSTEGLSLLEEMLQHAKGNPQLRPKAHVFLSLMRAFATKGKVDMVKMLQDQMVPEAAGRISPEDRAEADELLIEAAVNDGQLKLARQLLRNMIGLKKRLPLSNRAYLAIIRLQTLSNFGDNLFSPFVLQERVSLEDPVEKWMLTIEEAKPLKCDVQVSNVVMRFFRDPIVPIVDKWGQCVGVVHREDCFELNASLGELMRGPPPAVTTATPVSKVLSILLEPKVKVVAVFETKSYVYERSVNDKLVGFLTLERVLTSRRAGTPNSVVKRTEKPSMEATKAVGKQI